MNDQIDIDIIPLILELHKKVRGGLEEYLGDNWRIIKIEYQSITDYDATLKTRNSTEPEYIPCETLASLTIRAIENGPLNSLSSKNYIEFTAQMLSNGKMLIGDKRLLMGINAPY